MTTFWRDMYTKVKAALIAAGMIALIVAVDSLAEFGWVDSIGPAGYPIASGLVWFAAWLKRETTLPKQ